MFSGIVTILTMVGWFLIVLIPLVIIHEFGHLLMARLTKTRVVEFGVGIPPAWIKRKWKGIIWSLNYLPLGGFVKIYGDHDALDEASENCKQDRVRAKEVYLQNRFIEILLNRELEFFLQKNNLEYEQKWKEFEQDFLEYYKDPDKWLAKWTNNNQTPINFNNPEDESYQYYSQLKQLKTLIAWEFDSELNSPEVFFNKAWWQKILILLGGVVFNWLVAFLIFWMLLVFGGTGTRAISVEQLGQLKNDNRIEMTVTSSYPKVSRVLADYPAAQIGLEPGDELVSFAGTDLSSLTSLSEFSNLVKTNKDQEVEVVFRKSSTGELLVKTVKIEEKNNQLLFGIGSLYYNGFYKAKNVFVGFSLAVQTTYNYTVETIRLLGELVQALLPQTQDRTALQMVSGPIGVSYLSNSVFNFSGIRGILELMALISISLAVFNLVPLPALDGGRMVIVIISHLLGKRSRKLEAVLISATMILMLILGLLVAWQDITRITQ